MELGVCLVTAAVLFAQNLIYFLEYFLLLSNPAQYFFYCNESKSVGGLIQVVLCVPISDIFAAVIICVAYSLWHNCYA